MGRVDRDVCVAASGSDAKIGWAAHVVDAAPAVQSEDAAVGGLTFIFKRQGSIGVRRAFNGLIPAPEIHAAGNPANGLDVNSSLRIDTVTRFQALHDESERGCPARDRSQCRQPLDMK